MAQADTENGPGPYKLVRAKSHFVALISKSQALRHPNPPRRHRKSSLGRPLLHLRRPMWPVNCSASSARDGARTPSPHGQGNPISSPWWGTGSGGGARQRGSVAVVLRAPRHPERGPPMGGIPSIGGREGGVCGVGELGPRCARRRLKPII
ncbi:hypothetical protein BRADI_5g11676v3 [Brachypodium distachyon]|uniref:Uncharacterized protein n=1 Tax=Brachypodium distachyon TaxID=15368 RepID=A0A0Q3I9S1_BRADI|nr:hypothetical protein BRADI_5g11676v3 [Brachypodium distachyon]